MNLNIIFTRKSKLIQAEDYGLDSYRLFKALEEGSLSSSILYRDGHEEYDLAFRCKDPDTRLINVQLRLTKEYNIHLGKITQIKVSGLGPNGESMNSLDNKIIYSNDHDLYDAATVCYQFKSAERTEAQYGILKYAFGIVNKEVKKARINRV